jgi:hypothetical protein
LRKEKEVDVAVVKEVPRDKLPRKDRKPGRCHQAKAVKDKCLEPNLWAVPVWDNSRNKDH